jgi:predicted cupin superfamily sugar epimerase
MLPEVQALIRHFGMQPLPTEGTLFVATYRGAPLQPGGGARSSAMLGLYCDDPVSHSLFHRLPVDEVWHFHAGDPLRLVLLHPDGSSGELLLGNDPLAGHQVQAVVPARTWQAGHLVPGGRYALFGCTVVPGFDSTMFEGGAREVLLASHPARRDDILRFSCAPGHTRMPKLPGDEG